MAQLKQSLGWHDPTWQQLYPPAPPAPPQQPLAEPLPPSYLDRAAAAAAQGQHFNLTDLPGFQPNLSAPPSP